MSEILLRERAAEKLDELPDDVRRETMETLERVQDRPAEVLERDQSSGFFRVDVGDRVVLVDWERDTDQIYVLSIGRRSQTV